MNLYRQWLVKYGIHVGVAIALKRGAVTLAEIAEEAEDNDLLSGFTLGNTWLLDVRRVGPFTCDTGVYLKLLGPVLAADYPWPGIPPAMIDPPPMEPEAKRARP